MFRLVVSLGLTVIFALVSFLIYDTVGGHARVEVETQLTERIRSAHLSFSHLQQLSHSALRARAEKVAGSSSLIQALTSSPSDELEYAARHKLILGLLEQQRDRLAEQSTQVDQKQLGRLEDWNVTKPYFMIITDAKGQLIADLNNPRRFYKGEEGSELTDIATTFPAVEYALEGESFYDNWFVGQPLVIGVAPIFNDGEVIGVIALGDHINQNAQEYKRSLLADVGFFFNGKVGGSSTLSGSDESDLELMSAKLIAAYKSAPSEPIKIELGEQSLLVRLGRVEGHKTAESVHFFIATNWGAPLDEAMSVRVLAVIFTLVGLLMGLILFWVSLHYFVSPVKDIEEGVIKVTNGDGGYWFSYEVGVVDISPTICQHLDVMVSKLSGREMPELVENDEEA